MATERTIGGARKVCPGARSPEYTSFPKPVELTESWKWPGGTFEKENCPLSPEITSR
jgi:hypothetical protein